MPKFSIIIPLYNKANYISEAIQSVLSQTFKDFELIIINDCSTDNSLEIAKTFKDSRIRIIDHSQNQGLSASRNSGIKSTTTRYLAFLDGDDRWKPTFLEKINFLIQEYDRAAIFATNSEISLKNKKNISHSFDIANNKPHSIISNFFRASLAQTIFNHSSLCVERKVFESVGLYNESITYSEDIDFFIRSQAQFKTAYHTETLAIITLESENQITQSSIKGKVIPDYDYYEELFKGRKDIKKYLDFQRYIKAKLFRLSNDEITYKKLVKNIDFNNLTKKQRLLIKLPKMQLRLITSFKLWLQRIGIEVNSY